jgi:iron-sulfur cluster assembly protein
MNMISITQTACNKVSESLCKRGKGVGIKVGVKTTGCSGLAYILEYVDTPTPEFLSFIDNGIHIFVDPKAVPYVNGMTIDWTKKGLNEGFNFINPNERDRCGCGESFRV